ncbi:hypothetical protein SOVF_131680 [Spinacia oleracea]|nr:hypothetical protein SOVF_131680 [Spinacia oleracea]
MDCKTEFEMGLKSQLCKRLKSKEEVEQTDRISDLPDHIICDVLSYLTMEEVVRTSILSSRWRYHWKGVTSIRLWGSNSDPNSFANFVEHVLQNCNSTNLEVFNLSCPVRIDLPRLNTWIRYVLSLNIGKLSLYVNHRPFELPEFPLPICNLTCSSLVSVDLRSCFDIQIPDSVVCFPHLKSLDLNVIFPNNLAVLHRLLSCCPLLERLRLWCYLDDLEVLNLDISVPTLKRLDLWLQEEGYAVIRNYEIIINTPYLEYLSIHDNSLAHYVLNNLYGLRDVHIGYLTQNYGDIEPLHAIRLLELFHGIRSTDILTLHPDTLIVLESALSYPWPTFRYVTMLIVSPSSSSAWTCLALLLQSTPNLEVLILDHDEINDLRINDELYAWNPPESVPSCLLERLQKIGIKSFWGKEDEVEVVEYLLNHCQVLELMIIGFFSNKKDEKVAEKLLAFPRASSTCDVQVYEHFWFDSFIWLLTSLFFSVSSQI